MKYRIVKIWFFLLIGFKSFGQSYIEYAFPKDVQNHLISHLKKEFKKSPNNSYYCVIYLGEEKNVYTLSVESYNKEKSGRFQEMVEISNRVVLVDSLRIPVMFEYDYNFITYGGEEGEYLRLSHIYEYPYLIKFTKEGKITNAGFKLEN